MSNDIHTLKRQFLEHLEIERGRSLRTIETYGGYLDKFFSFGKFKTPKDITEDNIREFRIWLNRQPGIHAHYGETMKKKTQNYYLIALRTFLKYLTKRKIPVSLSADQIDLAKIPERSIDVISDKELERLLEAPNSEKDPEMRARDKAILEMLFSTGLRVSELCSLTRDIDLSLDELTIRGKGGKVRLVFLSDNAKKAVKEYLNLRKDMSNTLFVSLSSNRKKPEPTSAKNKILKRGEEDVLDRRSIERIVKKYAIIAGVTKRVTPHTIRHCFATDLLSNGADIRSVQTLLGHANITTTQIYTHITDKHLKEVYKKFHNKKEN
jgi:site-specific recombinase XerD